MKALTSGRFCPPHPGHFANLVKIAKKYESLMVVTLDYPGRTYPICYCQQIMEDFLDYVQELDIELVVNKTHFAEITKEELDSYGCDVYVGGNLKVLRHIENLGMKTEFVDRSFYYEASKIPLP